MSRETPFPVEDKNDEQHHTHNTLGSESESESELVGEFEENSSTSGQKGNHSPAEHSFTTRTLVPKSEQPAGIVLEKGYVMVCNNCRSGYNRTSSLHGVVDSLEDKKDEHSTRKSPYNTLGPDTDPESDHGHRKHSHNALGSESELVGEFEDNSTSAQKVNHSPHNSEVSDTRAESQQPGVLKKGYAMMCDVCAVENCRSGYNKPVLMMCYLCNTHGEHWPKNCPSGLYRGAPMPEQYGCFYWFNSNSTGA